ncbi:MAG: trypsin-like peptidase domain-containing protein [Clostridia bacterium]|nr:trypsin-like peptidase domain-containing protein [Clostridia bacterium]
MDDLNSNNLNNNDENNDIMKESVSVSEFHDFKRDNDTDNLKASSFYTESYKKPKRKNATVFQLIVVALISSIIGGSVVASFFQFVAPAVQPSVKNYFNKLIPGANQKETTTAQKAAPEVYKKVEITASDSPVSAIAEKVSPSIVGIRTTFKAQNFFFEDQDGKSEGSGIIIRSNGYIMTNYHVVESALNNNGKLGNGAKIEVILPNRKDKPYTAQMIGGDQRTDLAVIKIEAESLPAAELGNSDELKVGELAVAIGNPAGLEYMGSVTVGVISGLNRTIPIAENKELKLIQTDAAINPGNSGGALVNSQGKVVGINTAKMGGSGFEGLGFAIPINKAKEITDNLIEFKYVKGRPFIGISADSRFNEQVAEKYNVPVGVLVADVSPLSGAYKAGIKAGDIITKFDGKPVKNLEELNEQKNKHKPGDEVDVELYRDGETVTVKLKLSEDKG